jgi:isochorismate synthase
VPLATADALLGASPELLLRKEGDQFSSCRWPGRRVVSRMTCWIAKRATDCWLGKDRHEHELVTQAMKALLAPRSAAPESAGFPATDHHPDAMASGDAD